MSNKNYPQLADGRVIDRARAWCSMIGVPYFRFNPQMSVDLAMDEKMDIPVRLFDDWSILIVIHN